MQQPGTAPGTDCPDHVNGDTGFQRAGREASRSEGDRLQPEGTESPKRGTGEALAEGRMGLQLSCRMGVDAKVSLQIFEKATSATKRVVCRMLSKAFTTAASST